MRISFVDIFVFDFLYESSGTSAGERKLMPTIAAEMDRRQKLYSLLMPVMNLYVQLPLQNLVFIDLFVLLKSTKRFMLIKI